MDVREKLVELLDIIIQPGQKTLGDIADYLIANGVTVQEWISVDDRLPENGKEGVLIALRWGLQALQTNHLNGHYGDGVISKSRLSPTGCRCHSSRKENDYGKVYRKEMPDASWI